MTDDLRKLAQEHSGRADDAGRLARLLAQQLDIIDRLTAENEAQRQLLRKTLVELKTFDALSWQHRMLWHRDMLIAITQYLQSQGEKI